MKDATPYSEFQRALIAVIAVSNCIEGIIREGHLSDAMAEILPTFAKKNARLLIEKVRQHPHDGFFLWGLKVEKKMLLLEVQLPDGFLWKEERGVS